MRAAPEFGRGERRREWGRDWGRGRTRSGVGEEGLGGELFATDGAEAVGAEGEARGVAVGGDGGGVA